MILDSLLQFSAAAGDSITTGTTVSTNIIDLGITSGIPTSAQGGGARDIGIGDKPAMKLLVQCLATFLGGTSFTCALQGAVDNGSGAPSTFVTWWTPAAVVPLASLVAGARLYDMDMPRPPAGVAIPRYLQMTYTAAGTFSPAGKIGAFIVLDRDDQFYSGTNNAIMGGYPAGITIAN